MFLSRVFSSKKKVLGVLTLLSVALVSGQTSESSTTPVCDASDHDETPEVVEKKRSVAIKMIASMIASTPNVVDLEEEAVSSLMASVRDEVSLFLGNSYTTGELDDMFVEAEGLANDMINLLPGGRYADRYIEGMIDTINDYDCMQREFDMEDDEFQVEEAVHVLRKCKLLVLRNVLDKEFLMEYRQNFTNYIDAVNTEKIDPDSGGTSNGEQYFLHKIDDLRWEVILPREFASANLLAQPQVLEILRDPDILGSSMVLHSLGTALAEEGALAQRWHKDNDYLFSDSSLQTHGIAGHDMPAYSITMMVPLLNMTAEHGPTEFCMGTGWLSGMGSADEVPLRNEGLREEIEDFIDMQEYSASTSCPPRFWRSPQLNFGDLLLFDYQIQHRGGQNISPDLRAIMYMTYSRFWYKDSNFRNKSDEAEEAIQELLEERESSSEESDTRDYDAELLKLRQDAIVEELTETARFAEPEYDCEGETGSIEDCWAPSNPRNRQVVLEEIGSFLAVRGGDRSTRYGDKGDDVKFSIANVDLEHEGQPIEFITMGKRIDKLAELGPNEYVEVSAKAQSVVAARIKGGQILRKWTVFAEQNQLVVSRANLKAHQL